MAPLVLRVFWISILGFCLLDWTASIEGQPTKSQFPQRARRRSPIASTIFLGDWWDYYNRAIRKIEKGDLRGAEADLREAIKLHPEDNPHARTYGVRFQEYYANLELGTVLFQTGRYLEATSRLESSLKVAKLDETKFFLHEARRQLALERGDDHAIPQLALTQPPPGLVTNQNTVVVAGTVSDDIYVDEVYVGDESVLLPRASSQVDFEWEVDLKQEINRIPIVARDLVGQEQVFEVVVTLDQQGPVFSLQKIELAAGGTTARVVGEAYDPREVAALSANGQPISNPTGIRVPIDGEFPIRPGTNDTQLALLDGLGNVTRALLDPRMKVGKADSSETKVRVAAVGFDPRWLQSAVSAPKIDLMGLASPQRVYVPKVYIDGYASDSEDIQAITFDDAPLDIIPGSHLYFGKLVGPLHEGVNSHVISATDSGGVSATEVVQLDCQLPPEFQDEGRLAISIWPFDIKSNDPEGGTYSEDLVQALISLITRERRFQFVETEQLPSLLVDRRLAASELVDTRFQAPDRGVVPADLLLDGMLDVKENSLSLLLRVIRVSSGEIEAALEVHGIGKTEVTLKKMAEGIYRKLAFEYPVVRGEIFKIDSQIYSDLKKDTRVRIGAEVLAYHEDEELILPTGESAGSPPIPLGTMLIRLIAEKYTVLAPSKNMVEPPLVNDFVVTR